MKSAQSKSDTLSAPHSERVLGFLRFSLLLWRFVRLGSTPGRLLQKKEFGFQAESGATAPSPAYTKTRLCLLSFRIFPSLCLAVAMPFLGRLPGEEGHALITAIKTA